MKSQHLNQLRLMLVGLLVYISNTPTQAFEIKYDTPGFSLGAIAYGINTSLIGESTEAGLSPMAFFNSERIFLGSGMLGFRIFNQGTWNLSAILQSTAEALPREDNSLLNDMDNRDPALEAGFRWETVGDWGKIHFKAHQDISNTHDGYRAELEFNRLAWEDGQYAFTPVLGMRFRSKNVAHYYFGVPVEETKTGRPAYKRDAIWSTYLGFQYTYKLDSNWTLFTLFELENLEEDIVDSPIVESQNIITGGFGASYRF